MIAQEKNELFHDLRAQQIIPEPGIRLPVRLAGRRRALLEAPVFWWKASTGSLLAAA